MSDAAHVGQGLFGRDRELEQLRGLFEDAARGRGGLVFLVGEPGIGKTRLGDAAAEIAEGLGFRVAWGRAWESGGAPPYFPWSQALAVLGLRMPDPSLATAVEAEAARFQLISGVTGELRAACAKTPIALILDDLHVADISSLRMLQFVARELRSLHLAIVATRRDVGVRMTPEVESTFARIAREGRTLALGRLDRDEVGQLVRAEGPHVAGELEPAIWQASQGNPLFVGEIVRLLESDPTVARGATMPIPFGVREVIRQRLALLDATALQVLDVAAVAGVESDRPAVCVASGKGAAIVDDAIASATRAGVLSRNAPRDKIAFAHAQIRDALYQDLPRTKRMETHAAIAAALERREAPTPPLTEIAHHAIEGTAAVVPRVSRAVDAFARACADEDALGLVDHALAALDGSGDERGAAELRLLAGRTRMRIGDLAGGRACCVRAAETARAMGDAALFARAALAYAAPLTPGQTDPMTRALLEEALERLRRAPESIEASRLRVRAAARLAASLQPAPDPAEVARAAIGAVATARELGDDATLLDVLHSAGATVGEAVFAPETAAMARDAVRIGTALGERTVVLRSRLRLIFALMEVGDVAGAEANIDAFEADARPTNQPRHTWPIPLLRSMRALQEGRWSDCEALLEEAGELVARSADPMARYALLFHRFALLRQRDLPEVVALEPELLAMAGRWNEPETYASVMMALVRAVAGDSKTARDHLARVSLDSIPGRIRISIGMLAATAIRVGETERAATFYERIAAEDGRWHLSTLSGLAVEATYGRYLGALATMLGRWGDAERHLEGALTLARAASARPERARILAAYGSMLLARGGAAGVDRARRMFGEAKELAADLGLTRLAASLPEMPAVTEAPPASANAEAPAPPRPTLRLQPEGDTWLVALGGASVRLRDLRGLHYIARLVAEANREIHVLDLVGAGSDETRGDAGEMLDANARGAYKRRLAELDDELREAEAWNDGARIARARSEIELLSSELARAVGLGGQVRRAGSAAERARIAVTRRIRDLVKRAAELSPELGRYLESTIKTGTYCVYRPM